MNTPLSDRELHEKYNDFLDEAYPACIIATYTYSTSDALKEVDPTAYRCGFNDWLDGEISNGIFIEKNDEYYDANTYVDEQELPENSCGAV